MRMFGIYYEYDGDGPELKGHFLTRQEAKTAMDAEKGEMDEGERIWIRPEQVVFVVQLVNPEKDRVEIGQIIFAGDSEEDAKRLCRAWHSADQGPKTELSWGFQEVDADGFRMDAFWYSTPPRFVITRVPVVKGPDAPQWRTMADPDREEN